MQNESQTKLPKWQRWVPILRVTPSGKTMFVCLVCGRTNIAPDKTCPRIPRLEGLKGPTKRRFHHLIEEQPGLNKCELVEDFINDRISKRQNEDRLLIDLYENRLRSWVQRYCEICRGYGCQVCLGTGHNWTGGGVL